MRKFSGLGKRISVFWSLFIANMLPCICSAAILFVIFIPTMNEAARKNDDAYEQNMLYVVKSYIDSMENEVRNSISTVENTYMDNEQSTWLHYVYIDHILEGHPLAYSTKNAITKALAVLTARSSPLCAVSLQFLGHPDEIYSDSGVYTNLAFYQEAAPQELKYRFFPIGDGKAGFSSITFQDTEYLIYRAPLYDVSGGRAKGEINFIFSSGAVGKYLDTATDSDVSAFRIADAEGKVLWQFAKPGSEEEAVTVSCGSDRGSYRFDIEVPLSVHGRTELRNRPLMHLSVALVLTVCIALSVALSMMNYRPFENIVRRFAGNTARGNELEALSQIMDRIILEKEATEDSLGELRPLARQKIIGEYLEGTVLLWKPNAAQLGYCGLEFDYARFCVISVRAPFSGLGNALGDGLDRAQKSELAMEALIAHLQGNQKMHVFLSYEDGDNYRIIANYEDEREFSDYVALLSKNCTEYFAHNGTEDQVCFGVGSEVGTAEEIYRSAEEAATAENFCTMDREKNVVYYEDIASQIGSAYYFPLSEETLLSRAVLDGNADGAKGVVQKVIEANAARPPRSPAYLRWLYSDMCSAVMRSAGSMGVVCCRREPKKFAALAEIGSDVEAIIDDVCAEIRRRRVDPNSFAEQQIIAYVDDNLMNPNLSLNGVAEKFHKSSAYISVLFKRRRNVNYSDYVNQSRVARAAELLKRGGKSMEDVYREVGYVSLSTFRRNFIKYTKCSPGNFSESTREPGDPPEEGK